MIVLVILLTSPSPDYKWSLSWPSLHQSLAPQWWKYSGDANYQPVTKLSWTLAFLQKTLSKQVPHQKSGLFFRFTKNLRRLPKALFAEGCQLASFPVLGPHPAPASARWLLSEINFISLHYFRYILRGEKGVDIILCFFSIPRRWWKSSLATYQMVVWWVWRKSSTNQYFWTDPI